jgi:hypothetical protein
MNLISWLVSSKGITAESKADSAESEKKMLRAELAQTVITFERRRYRVHKIAEQALQRMRDD